MTRKKKMNYCVQFIGFFKLAIKVFKYYLNNNNVHIIGGGHAGKSEILQRDMGSFSLSLPQFGEVIIIQSFNKRLKYIITNFYSFIFQLAGYFPSYFQRFFSAHMMAQICVICVLIHSSAHFNSVPREQRYSLIPLSSLFLMRNTYCQHTGYLTI